MHRFFRTELSDSVSKYLEKKQREVDGGKEPRVTWDCARRTKSIVRVASTLQRMTGVRQRCMFCEDSRGTDIDHFWPISPYKEKTFPWENHLWVCAACNRQKSNKFDLAPDGTPLLIDPTAEDPWDFLFYDSCTDNITGRYDPDTADVHPKGRHTVEHIHALGHEAVTEGRGRTRRNLRKSVKTFLERIASGIDPTFASTELLESIDDNDGYGLRQWYFLRDGRDEPPFADLRQQHPSLWQDIIARMSPPYI